MFKGKVAPNICCIGTDYVGVPTCAVIASKCPSINIAVIDLDPNKILIWNTKQIPSREPGLEDLLRKCQNRNLLFTPDNEGAIQAADIIFISMRIPSEPRESGDVPNIAKIEQAARLIAKSSTTNKIVVEKSTVPVGTVDVIKRLLQANKINKVKFQVLSNPEFYTVGSAIKSLLYPKRILIGSEQNKDGLYAAEILASIYATWVSREKIITMSSWSAELTKLCENAMLAQRLSSINSMSMICEVVGTDVSHVVRMLGRSVLGSQYLEPSMGYGGPHLTNDLKCLIYMCEKLNLPEIADYWRQIELINDLQKKRFKKKIVSSFSNMMKNKKVAIWGFAFKKNVEITAESPAYYICEKMLDEGAKINIYDPHVDKKILLEELKISFNLKDPKSVTISEDPYKAASKAHAIVCCTDEDEFKSLDYNAIYKDMMRPAYIFDGKKYLPHKELINIGFIVKTIGREFREAKAASNS